MTPTRQEELQAFYQQVLPGFLEYLRSHQSAIEQVELATSKDGIVSFPATQILGGVLKTVRVPLPLITADIDQAEEYAREMGDYAKVQGDYAKAQGNYAKAEGDYADEKGTYAQTQGNAALAAKNTVTSWYTPFHDAVEAWAAQAEADETARVSAETVRQSQESTRQSQEQARETRAASDHTRAESDHTTATTDHSRAESDHSTAVQDHTTATADHATYGEDHAISEAQQSTFEANEAQRQQDFEDAEQERMETMLVTKCFVDTLTMHLMFCTPVNNTTEFAVSGGHLQVSFDYETI